MQRLLRVLSTCLIVIIGVSSTVMGAASAQTLGSAQGLAANTDQTLTPSGGSVPWLWILILGLAAFLALRWFSGRRRTRAALENAMAEDRAEIREQLENNADHVIDLGDQIANADDELRRMYEEAAQAYQDVSMGIDDASTPAEIDALDDKIDRAEWQFQVIEARLAGRTPPAEPDRDAPPPPADRPGGRQPVPPLGGDTRIPTSQAPTSPRRSGGGLRSGLGGLLSSGLGSMLLRMLISGGLGAMSGSRRTRQRQSQNSGAGSRRSRRSGRGLGGGVLR